jgi:hypothetical protein
MHHQIPFTCVCSLAMATSLRVRARCSLLPAVRPEQPQSNTRWLRCCVYWLPFNHSACSISSIVTTPFRLPLSVALTRASVS